MERYLIKAAWLKNRLAHTSSDIITGDELRIRGMEPAKLIRQGCLEHYAPPRPIINPPPQTQPQPHRTGARA